MRSWEEPGEFIPTPEEEVGMIAEDTGLCAICRHPISDRYKAVREVEIAPGIHSWWSDNPNDVCVIRMNYHESCLSACEYAGQAEELIQCMEARVFRGDGEDGFGPVTPTYYCRDRKSAIALVSQLFSAGYCDVWTNPMPLPRGVVGLLPQVQLLHGDDVRERKEEEATA